MLIIAQSYLSALGSYLIKISSTRIVPSLVIWCRLPRSLANRTLLVATILNRSLKINKIASTGGCRLTSMFLQLVWLTLIPSSSSLILNIRPYIQTISEVTSLISPSYSKPPVTSNNLSTYSCHLIIIKDSLKTNRLSKLISNSAKSTLTTNRCPTLQSCKTILTRLTNSQHQASISQTSNQINSKTKFIGWSSRLTTNNTPSSSEWQANNPNRQLKNRIAPTSNKSPKTLVRGSHLMDILFIRRSSSTSSYSSNRMAITVALPSTWTSSNMTLTRICHKRTSKALLACSKRCSSVMALSQPLTYNSRWASTKSVSSRGRRRVLVISSQTSWRTSKQMVTREPSTTWVVQVFKQASNTTRGSSTWWAILRCRDRVTQPGSRAANRSNKTGRRLSNTGASTTWSFLEWICKM